MTAIQEAQALQQERMKKINAISRTNKRIKRQY